MKSVSLSEGANKQPQKDTSGFVTIREVCSQLNITPRTARFYEQRGLISSLRVGRTMPRLYSVDQRKRLEQIVKAKQLGFTLTEIGELLEKGSGESRLRGGLPVNRQTAQRQLRHLMERRAQIDQAIDDLSSMLAPK